MADLNYSRSFDFLQDRVEYLEESNQRFISILEMLASSSEFQGDLSSAKNTESIFKATANQLQRLFSFTSIGFLDSQPDGSFELILTEPGEACTVLQNLVEARMMDGTFAWALNRNQAVLVPIESSQTLLLQVLSTQNSVRGMFVATLPGTSASLDAASLNALSIVLFTCAYALESTVLYAMLNDHTQNLEERVLLRTRDLEEARKQAEAANLAKSDFLANMSHEIRTPMNGVLGMTEVMLKGGLTPQKEKLYLQAIKDSADSLMLIINDILDFSKIEAGKFTLDTEPFSLRNVMDRCLNVLILRAEEKGLRIEHTIHHDVPECLVGDHGRLRQIFTNLIGNAIKFCHQGQITIDVSVETQDISAVTLYFRITDTGIGIAPEACQRIFSQFEQADSSTTRKFGGTGLGLAICKKLVELMEGKIWVESQVGIGSCFQFTAKFTVGDEKNLEISANTNTSAITCGKNCLSILLVDDVEINRVLIQAILEPLGHHITNAENGIEAVRAFETNMYDIVLMDIQMPEMDGLQASQVIRNFEVKVNRNQLAPIIAMTAFAGNEDRQRCIDAGMTDYLTKPVKSEKLLHILSLYCRSKNSLHVSENKIESGQSVTPLFISESEKTDKTFDYDELLERLGGRAEMIPRFIGFFCKGTAPQLEELASAVSAMDATRIQRSAHAIKGAAGNIAARRMYAIASGMEQAGKCGEIDAAHLQLNSLTFEYQFFLQEISALKLLPNDMQELTGVDNAQNSHNR